MCASQNRRVAPNRKPPGRDAPRFGFVLSTPSGRSLPTQLPQRGGHRPTPQRLCQEPFRAAPHKSFANLTTIFVNMLQARPLRSYANEAFISPVPQS
jgi:hypothetical protein